jgi:hypothetical protein
MIHKFQRTGLAASIAVMLGACGAGGGDTAFAPPSSKTLATITSSAGSACLAAALNGIDAQTLTGASTPLRF